MPRSLHQQVPGYVERTALPFGFGLNYGQFELSDLRVAPAIVGESDIIEASIRVTNQGQREAEETVFLFTHDKFASVARPLLELKGFTKISLRPGESGTVTIRVPASDLRFPGLDLKPLFEPGDVEILVGRTPIDRSCRPPPFNCVPEGHQWHRLSRPSG